MKKTMLIIALFVGLSIGFYIGYNTGWNDCFAWIEEITSFTELEIHF